MRINVDGERCIGSGLCALAVPEVFAQDDEGASTVLSGHEDDGADERVRSAVRSCPVQAISVTGGSTMAGVHQRPGYPR
jgi:ferredoxin